MITFEEMCKARDPLYAAMQPVGAFLKATLNDRLQNDWILTPHQRELLRLERDLELFPLAIRALRNQGEPYPYPRP